MAQVQPIHELVSQLRESARRAKLVQDEAARQSSIIAAETAEAAGVSVQATAPAPQPLPQGKG
jgi:hypothetical protein